MKILFLISYLFLIQNIAAQALDQQLQAAYDSFENKKLDSLLIEANKNYPVLDLKDRVVFHKYSAFKAFQNGERQIAMDHFGELIKVDPSYTLDALTTSPKLIMLFDKAKIEYLEAQQRRLNELTTEKSGESLPWRSLVFPGWEQWNRGAKTKAIAWATAGMITLAGTVQSIVRTASKREAYLNETVPEKIKSKFDSYNDTYRSQYYWAYALTSVWIASHIDAVFFTLPENTSLTFIPKPNNELTINLAFNF